MADTTFQDRVTPIQASWLNDVNRTVYDLSGTGTSKGANLVGYKRDIADAVAATVQKYLEFQSLNVFEFMTAAEIAAVQAYSYAVNVTTAVQKAMNAAALQSKPLFCPSGGYLVTTLQIPATSGTYRSFRMFGSGAGQPFAISAPYGTTFKSTTSGTVIKMNSVSTPDTEPEIEIANCRFWGNGSTPVADIAGLYGISQIHHNVFYQEGVGDGLKVSYGATCHIYHNYALNRDLVTVGLFSVRVGVGFNIPNNYDSGLVTLTKNSSRGWLTGYQLGAGAGVMYSAQIEKCEASTIYHGVLLEANTQGCTVSDMYIEGQEGGYGVKDFGRYNTVKNCFMFPGFLIGIYSGPDTYGGLYDGNTISTTGANTTCIKLDCTGVYSGLSRSCTNNKILFGASGGTVANVVGLQITGSSPPLHLSGNVYNPNGAWVGGAGTKRIDDQTTGTGIKGFMDVAYGTGGQVFPKVSLGAYSVYTDTTTLTQANVSAGVLTISDASDFVMTCTTPTSASIISVDGKADGKIFWITTTNNQFTFTNSATLKMSGGVNYTPGANGAQLGFKMRNGVAWEFSRTAY